MTNFNRGSFKQKAYVFLQQPWLLYLMVVIIAIVIVKVVDINVYPYKILVKDWVSPTTGSLKNIVGIGWIIRKFNLFQADLLALFFYVIIQFFELLPKIIESDKILVKKLLASCQNIVTPSSKDKKVVRNLKKALQPLAITFKAYADTLRVIAYVVDAFVCYAGYPFFIGVARLYQIDKMLEIIGFGQFDRIDWNKVVLFSLTVYGVEFLLKNLLGIISLIRLKQSA